MLHEGDLWLRAFASEGLLAFNPQSTYVMQSSPEQIIPSQSVREATLSFNTTNRGADFSRSGSANGMGFVGKLLRGQDGMPRCIF